MKKKKFKKSILFILIIIILLLVYLLLSSFLKLDVKNTSISVNSKYEEKVSSSFLGKDLSKKVEKDGKVNTKKIGTYEIKYTVKYLIFKKSKTIKVEVKDNIKPEIKLKDANTLFYATGVDYKEPGVTASDNIDGDITKKVKATNNIDKTKEGTYEVTYTVSDKAGNKIDAKRKVIYTKPNTNGVAVLNYHFFYDPDQGEECNEGNCEIVSDFKKQLDYLKENNFKTLTIKEFRDWMYGELEVPEKSVLITVDDGAKGTGKHNGNKLNPILEQYQMHATLFLITGWWDIENYRGEYLDIESHTNDMHTGNVCKEASRGAKMLCSTNDFVMNDLKKSIEITKSKIAFCYPFYVYNETTTRQVKEAGFELAFIGGGRKATKTTDKWHVPRYQIVKTTPLERFIQIVN